MSNWEIIYAEESCQEYTYGDGSRVPIGEPVGIEKGDDEFIMLNNVRYLN